MSNASIPKLSDADLYTDQLPRGRDCSEDAGFIVTASTDDHDIYLYLCAYVLRSEGKGIWLKRDGRINGTILIAIPRGRRGQGLFDNPFARSGWHVNQYLEPDDHKILRDGDKVEWRMGGRNYIWRRGSWATTGTHGDVETDLIFRPSGPLEWRWGPFEQIVETDSAGYKVAARVEGTIRSDGHVFELRNGYATCERAAVGQSRDIVAELVGGHEVFAFEIRDGDLDIQIHRHTGRKMEAAGVREGNVALAFGPHVPNTKVEIATVDHVYDPRSGLRVPCRWEIALSSADASASLEVLSSGRSYFHYNTHGGVMLMMQILGSARGSVRMPDGTVRTIADAMVGLRWGRGLLFANETLAGSIV